MLLMYICITSLLASGTTFGIIYAAKDYLTIFDGGGGCTNHTIYVNQTIYVNTTEYIPFPRSILTAGCNETWPISGDVDSEDVNVTEISVLIIEFNTTFWDWMWNNSRYDLIQQNIAGMHMLGIYARLNWTLPGQFNVTVEDGFTGVIGSVEYSIHWSNDTIELWKLSLLFGIPDEDIPFLFVGNRTNTIMTCGNLNYDTGAGKFVTADFGLNSSSYKVQVTLDTGGP